MVSARESKSVGSAKPSRAERASRSRARRSRCRMNAFAACAWPVSMSTFSTMSST